MSYFEISPGIDAAGVPLVREGVAIRSTRCPPPTGCFVLGDLKGPVSTCPAQQPPDWDENAARKPGTDEPPQHQDDQRPSPDTSPDVSPDRSPDIPPPRLVRRAVSYRPASRRGKESVSRTSVSSARVTPGQNPLRRTAPRRQPARARTWASTPPRRLPSIIRLLGPYSPRSETRTGPPEGVNFPGRSTIQSLTAAPVAYNSHLGRALGSLGAAIEGRLLTRASGGQILVM
jgi:hypothetical protein